MLKPFSQFLVWIGSGEAKVTDCQKHSDSFITAYFLFTSSGKTVEADLHQLKKIKKRKSQNCEIKPELWD